MITTASDNQYLLSTYPPEKTTAIIECFQIERGRKTLLKHHTFSTDYRQLLKTEIDTDGDGRSMYQITYTYSPLPGSSELIGIDQSDSTTCYFEIADSHPAHRRVERFILGGDKATIFSVKDRASFKNTLDLLSTAKANRHRIALGFNPDNHKWVLLYRAADAKETQFFRITPDSALGKALQSKQPTRLTFEERQTIYQAACQRLEQENVALTHVHNIMEETNFDYQAGKTVIRNSEQAKIYCTYDGP